MSHRVLTYRDEKSAKRALKRHLKNYEKRHGCQIHPDCRCEVVSSPSWLYPFKYLIRMTAPDGSQAYWSAAR